LPLPLLWFMLSTRTSGCGILNGIQTDAFSEILSVGINIETLKNETQAGLTSQASFVVDMERRFSGDCVGNANNLKCGAAPILVQARTLLQSKMFFDHGNHDVDEENVGLPGIANKKTPRVLAWSPSPNLNQLATYVDTAAKLAHQRLGVHWWAWLPLATGAVLVFSFALIAAIDSHTQRREVHLAHAACAGKGLSEGRTQPLEHGNPASFSLLTSPSAPLVLSKQTLRSSSSTVPLTQAPDDGPFLCPELAVPATCECILRLNLKPAPFTPAVVMDADGNSVMRVSIQGSTFSQAAFPCDARRVLLTTEEGYILAQCRGSQRVDREFYLLRADGEIFGKLWQTETQSCGPDGKEHTVYTVRYITGTEWHFRGFVPQLTLDVTDSAGRLLAMSRPEADPGSPEMPSQHLLEVNGHVSWVRVASLMDVSIVLCGLLTITNLM